MKTQISKAYRRGEHVGWKKTIGHRSWFLVYGITPAAEMKAISLAEVLEAKWRVIKAAGGTELLQTHFDEARDFVAGPTPVLRQAAPVEAAVALPAPVIPPSVTSQMPAPAPTTGRSVYEAIDQFMGNLKRQMKPDSSNADHLLNTCDRIIRAKDGLANTPLEKLRRKELDDWLAFFGSRPPSKKTGNPIGPVTIRNIIQSIRMFLNQCIEWEWWSAPPAWERAFRPFTIKRLSTDAEKRLSRKRPVTHNLAEKRVLWHLGRPFHRAMMALADWGGHTQKEIATLRFDNFLDVNGEMYIERHRNKTGVEGRWWIPPEAAAAISAELARTPRDPKVNPDGLAFLTPNNLPLVHRSNAFRRAKSDFVRPQWSTLLRWASGWGVRNFSFKYMRKGTSQMVRDRTYGELSKLFCAQTTDDVQDVSYSRPSPAQLEKCIREIYAEIKGMYEPIDAAHSQRAIEDVYRSRGLTPPNAQQSAA